MTLLAALVQGHSLSYAQLRFEHSKPYVLFLKESAGPSLGQSWKATCYQPLWT